MKGTVIVILLQKSDLWNLFKANNKVTKTCANVGLDNINFM